MDSNTLHPEAWDITVIRAQGLRLMRPEKAWRPIVTVEVDRMTAYEMVLGVDGQNPNLKQGFRFFDVKPTSTCEIKVWHRSQSKKKAKKRNLVATATTTLGDLVKRLEAGFGGGSSPSSSATSLLSPRTEIVGKGNTSNQIDLRLACQTPSKKLNPASASKGRPRNGTSLTIKLVPPPNLGAGWRPGTPRLEGLAGSRERLSVSGGSPRGRVKSFTSLSPRVASSSSLKLEVNDNLERHVEEVGLKSSITGDMRRRKWFEGDNTSDHVPRAADTHSSSSSAFEHSPPHSPVSESAASSSHSTHSHTLIDVHPPSPTTSPTAHGHPHIPSESQQPPLPPGLRRRRVRRKSKPAPMKGYSLFSDEDDKPAPLSPLTSSYSVSDSESSSCSAGAGRLDDMPHLRLSGGSSNSFFFEDAVRSTPLDSAFDSYSDVEEFEVKGVELVDPSAPRTISLALHSHTQHSSKETTTTTTKTKTGDLEEKMKTTTRMESVTRWIAASLLPQHVLAHPAPRTQHQNATPSTSGVTHVQGDDDHDEDYEDEDSREEVGVEDEEDEVPPYTETDITNGHMGPSKWSSQPTGDLKDDNLKEKILARAAASASTSKTPSPGIAARLKKGRASKRVLKDSSSTAASPFPSTKSAVTSKSTGNPETKRKSKSKDKNANAWWETLLGNFTPYLTLRAASTDTDFEDILAQLRLEWTFMAGFLCALGAVDVAVLAIDSDTPLVPLTPLALRAIALSSCFTGLGLAGLAYFVLRYSLSGPKVFRTRARDVYGGYGFFSVGARVPAVCMGVSVVGVLGFLGAVAFEMWPGGVVVGCGIVGCLMGMQFLVFGVHMVCRGIVGAGRGAVRGVGRVIGRGKPVMGGESPSARRVIAGV